MWKTPLQLVRKCAIIGMVPTAHAIIYPNPINATSLPDLITSIADALVFVAAPIAVVAIIIAGFMFVVGGARGDDGSVTAARKMFLWVLIGTAIIVGASLLAHAVVNTIKAL
ncbi:MAG: hypothetical protein A3C07_01270 [Candidatus Sungbacteria bacterium RIFCSPHIGHO2_02_FULL_47_11]|uniref:Conjugal transfer protein TrbC n=1 Tax=Candidatus Sungbacteria bacterium RIFCSPHIGHO2_02_FULL_47_11 TaxID=1802270 RepID=A0A1G2KPV4_9BACT|nr:MAG: hypothetical protein A3C07_01270 [Candidatus Sungbacteria bacterium RIFCSPHIGHO2_02_FULL_47_11]